MPTDPVDAWTKVATVAQVVGVLLTLAAVVAALEIATTDRRAARRADDQRRHVDLLLRIQALIAGVEQGRDDFRTWALIRGLVAALPEATPVPAVRQTYGGKELFKPRGLEDMKALHRAHPNIKGAEWQSEDYLLTEVAHAIRWIGGAASVYPDQPPPPKS